MTGGERRVEPAAHFERAQTGEGEQDGDQRQFDQSLARLLPLQGRLLGGVWMLVGSSTSCHDAPS